MNFWRRAWHTWLLPLAAVTGFAWATGSDSPVMSTVLLLGLAWWALNSWRYRRRRRKVTR
jgi:hypothetical protein